MRNVLTRRRAFGAFLILALLICAKFFWTWFAFPGVPFGYDAGIYRFLFIRESMGWPPFVTPHLPEWAKSHAPGLFFMTSPLLWLGVSPDVLIGWVWNLIPIVLASTLSFIWYRRSGMLFAITTLLCALLSIGQMQGFLMMYYKVFVALLFCILAFHAFERSSWTLIPLGMLTIAIHQQIGLIFCMACLSALLTQSLTYEKPRATSSLRTWFFCITSFVLGGLWYLPTYQRSLKDLLPNLTQSVSLLTIIVAVLTLMVSAGFVTAFLHQKKRTTWFFIGAILLLISFAVPTLLDAPRILSLLRPAGVEGGAFFTIYEYVLLSWPLLFLGALGFGRSFKEDRGTVWQWSLLWCAIAAFGMFFFYRRFLLPFDFFLIPYVALGALWMIRSRYTSIILSLLFLVQTWSLVMFIRTADPHIDRSWLEDFSTLSSSVQSGTHVIVLDNMAPWIAGYLPFSDVSGPGIFNSRPYDEWEKFLLGDHADRSLFFGQYPLGTYFYASPVFSSYYPPEVRSVLTHSCLRPVGASGLFRSVCGQ